MLVYYNYYFHYHYHYCYYYCYYYYYYHHHQHRRRTDCCKHAMLYLRGRIKKHLFGVFCLWCVQCVVNFIDYLLWNTRGYLLTTGSTHKLLRDITYTKEPSIAKKWLCLRRYPINKEDNFCTTLSSGENDSATMLQQNMPNFNFLSISSPCWWRWLFGAFIKSALT